MNNNYHIQLRKLANAQRYSNPWVNFRPFITTWKTDNSGVSNSTSIQIPTYAGETYDYEISWKNDGVWERIQTDAPPTHDYGVAGIYEVAIRGVFPIMRMRSLSDNKKILSVEQWGDVVWNSMTNMFISASNFNGNSNDIPQLTNELQMNATFDGATIFNQDIGNWDVSKVTQMNATFNGAVSFNQDIGGWDVSNVTQMIAMFQSSGFNQDIGNWDVGSVTNMNGMFANNSVFNQNLGSWNVSNVIDMAGMLYDSPLSTENYSNTLIGWASLPNLQMNVRLDANLAHYNEAGAIARQYLIDTYNWTINDAGAEVAIGAITDLSITSFSDSSISLTWTNPTSTPNALDHFKVMVDGVFRENTTTAHNSWTVTGLSASTTYSIQLIAVDTEGNEGGLSNAVSQQTHMRPFITTWKTDNAGTSASNQITIPTTGGGYNYDVDFGDGTGWKLGKTGNVTYTYASAGTYTVKIRGLFPRIFFNGGGDRYKIQSIEQWGNIQWSSMVLAFSGCFYLKSFASDIPNLNAVTSCASAFSNCSNFNPTNVVNWGTQNVTNMNSMFFNTIFNQDIGSWNIKNLQFATDMFKFVTISTANYDAILNGWSAQTPLKTGVTVNFGNSKYSSAAAGAKSILETTWGWTILDAGQI